MIYNSDTRTYKKPQTLSTFPPDWWEESSVCQPAAVNLVPSLHLWRSSNFWGFMILLMDEVRLTNWYVRFSHYLQGFIHVWWCRISSININLVPSNQPSILSNTSILRNQKQSFEYYTSTPLKTQEFSSVFFCLWAARILVPGRSPFSQLILHETDNPKSWEKTKTFSFNGQTKEKWINQTNFKTN